VFLPHSRVFWIKSAVIKAGPTSKSTVPQGMSFVCWGTIPTPLNSIHAKFSTRIHKIMRFFFCVAIGDKRFVDRHFGVLYCWGNVMHLWGNDLPSILAG
jgi:hypothetical protein